MKKYVVGFMFDDRFKTVLLIKKTKPEWQAGMLNGVGGKVEQTDATVDSAMVREFEEETGLKTAQGDWTLASVMQTPDAAVAFYWAAKPYEFLCGARSTTDEEVRVVSLGEAEARCLENLPWLMEYCLYMAKGEWWPGEEYNLVPKPRYPREGM